ncbi:MAG: hypothetical protein ACKV0T_22390, partial [Planctomycetales bacterium]
MRNPFTWLLLALFSLGLTLGTQAGGGTYTLSSPAMTSAGVFASDGSLVRTLWSGVARAAGTHPVEWDGADELGVPFTNTVTAKVLAHNVGWVWEGVIGNTSRNRTGPDKLRSFEAMWGVGFAPGGAGFAAVGYNEQQFPMFRFHQNDFQARLPVGRDDYQRSFSLVAVDSNRVYFANTGSGFNATNFVIAFDHSASNLPQHLFTAGVVEAPEVAGQRWESVIDRGTSRITGLAVQGNGALLFIAHREDNLVKVFDKQSGVQTAQIAVDAPEALAASPAGDLWVVCRVNGLPVVRRFVVFASVWFPVLTISSLEVPLAVTTSPDGGTVVVADGGGRQQLRAFSTAGQPLWTLG